MTETITLAGGCFWCLDAAFRRVAGVRSVTSGYANGDTQRPSYEAVCSGRTGHAEAVRIVYDPAVVPLAHLLDLYFAIHDPTTLNRQGHDVGTQYRSGIYLDEPVDAAQRAEVESALARAAQTWGPRIVTEVEPLRAFWPAEDEHQDYYTHHPSAGYCMAVVRPKVAKAEAIEAARAQGR